MITVHQCKVWHDRLAQWEVEPGWYTIEAIDQIPKAHAVPGTEREVEEAMLDEHGRLSEAR